jgi:hypothetical protein
VCYNFGMSKSILFRRQLDAFSGGAYINWENDNDLSPSSDLTVSMYTNGASRISISLDNYNTSVASVRATLFVEPLGNCLTQDYLLGKAGTPSSPSGLIVTSAVGTSNYMSIPCTFEIMAVFLETLDPGIANVGVLLVGWNGQA